MKSKIQAQKVDESAMRCIAGSRNPLKSRFESKIRTKIFSKSFRRSVCLFTPLLHMARRANEEAQQLHNYVNKLLRDTGLENIRDLESFMSDQDLWGQFPSRHLPRVDRKFIRSKYVNFKVWNFMVPVTWLLSKGCIENRPQVTRPNFKSLLNLFKKTWRTICRFSEVTYEFSNNKNLFANSFLTKWMSLHCLMINYCCIIVFTFRFNNEGIFSYLTVCCNQLHLYLMRHLTMED